MSYQRPPLESTNPLPARLKRLISEARWQQLRPASQNWLLHHLTPGNHARKVDAVLRCMEDELPEEVMERIFGWMAVAAWGTHEGVRMANRVDAAGKAIDMLQHAPLIAAAVAAKDDIDTAMTSADRSLARKCLQLATTAVLQYLVILPATISSPNPFPSAVGAGNHPFVGCAGFLRHLELCAKVPSRASHAAPVYPVELYRLQHNLHLIDAWYAKLHTITITLLIPPKTDPPPSLCKRGFSGASTTLFDELVVLAGKMDALSNKGKLLRIGQQRKSEDGGITLVEYGEMVDAEMVEEMGRSRVLRAMLEEEYGEWWMT